MYRLTQHSHYSGDTRDCLDGTVPKYQFTAKYNDEEILVQVKGNFPFNRVRLLVRGLVKLQSAVA